MFGGTLSRNMVNLIEKNMPTEWSIDEDAKKTSSGSPKLGSKLRRPDYIAGAHPHGHQQRGERDPKVKGDKGIVMCFDEASGKFLYQMVFNKLRRDWSTTGRARASARPRSSRRTNSTSSATAARWFAPTSRTAKSSWTKDMIKDLQVFPHTWRCARRSSSATASSP